jgi:hypothetical protein
MNVIVSQKNLIYIVDKLISHYYGEKISFVESEGLFFFFKQSMIEGSFKDENFKKVSIVFLADTSFFEGNSKGTIFVNDTEFFNFVRSVLGYNDKNTGEALLNYFKHKFTLNLNRIVYH